MPSKEDNGMNSICEEHGRLRCDICALIDELKEENARLKEQLVIETKRADEMEAYAEGLEVVIMRDCGIENEVMSMARVQMEDKP